MKDPMRRARIARALLETSPALLGVASAATPLQFDYLSGNCRERLGYDAERVVTEKNFWIERIHAADRKRVQQALAGGAGRQGRADVRVSYRLRTAAGVYARVEHLARLTRIEPGAPSVWVSACVVTRPARGAPTAPEAVAAARAGHDAQHLDSLTTMAERLALCVEMDDLLRVLDEIFSEVFEGDSGAILGLDARDDTLRLVAGWGEAPALDSRYPVSACIAARTRQVHRNLGNPREGLCDHLPPTQVPAYTCVPMLIDDQALGILHLRFAGYTALEPQRFASRCVLAEHVANLVGACLVNIRLRESLQSKAVRDPLTRLYNRRFFDETLQRELANARRADHDLALLMIDIDRFKRINDSHGHAIGDRVLAGFAEHLAHHVRAGDVACRYGGEEFAVIMPGIAPHDARNRAEAIRTSLHAWRVAAMPADFTGVTVSVGVAVYPHHGLTNHELLAAADRALYRAKRAGRDQTVEADRRDAP